MKKLLTFLLLLAIQANAQCDCGSADVEINANTSSDYTFLENTTYCINGNITIQWAVYFEDNVTICIPVGSSLTIDNQMPQSSSYPSSNEVTWNVEGTLKIPNLIPVSFDVNIFDGGTMTGISGSSQDLNVYGDYLNLTVSEGGSYNFGNTNLHNSVGVNTFTNYGTIQINGEISTETNTTSLEFYNYGTTTLTGNLSFSTGGGNLFENYGTLSCDGLYSTDPTLHMKNEGTISLSANYDDTPTSILSNCGTFNMNGAWGFNLEGTFINTGDLNASTSSIAFDSSTRIENYSNMYLKGITMGTAGAVFYNEGYVEFYNSAVYDVKFYGPGSSEQPEHSTSSNYGQFVLYGTSNGAAILKGNLNFLNNDGSDTQSGCFGSVSDLDDTVVFGECSTCTVVTEYDQCANADGTWPVVAPDPNEAAIHNTLRVNRHIRTNLKN